MPVNLHYDMSRIERLANAIAAAGPKSKTALRLGMQKAGNMARTAMRGEVVTQTGLKYKTIKKAVTGGMRGDEYVIHSGGGNVRLKYFRARETRKGTTAYPRNKKTLFPGVFIKGGRFPKRVALGMGGMTFKRVGKARLPIKGIRSGVFIPEEMVTGGSQAVFYATAEREMPRLIEAQLYRILGSF